MSNLPPSAVAGEAGFFFSLTPERVLEAVERAGLYTTGLAYALNSLENRVYEVELEDGRRVIGKFYRPGRWSRETILDEHRLLAALAAAEIPVCGPTPFADGETLKETPEGIHFALFPRTGGRSPEELGVGQLEELGRLLGRIHNVSASLDLRHRPELSPATYGRGALGVIQAQSTMPDGLLQRFSQVAEEIIGVAEGLFAGRERLVAHADCHRGNLLYGREGWFFLDFDDMAWSPPVQDLWLLLPGRVADAPLEVEALVRGYEQFRPFEHGSPGLIEALRALRYLRYAAWVASRWQDPAFPRAFPYWGTDAYWQGQLQDLYEQQRLLAGGSAGWDD